MAQAGPDVVSAVRDERWTRTDTWLFVSFAIGYIMEAYIFTLAPVAASSWFPKEGTAHRSLLLSWAPLWLIIGIAIAGPLGDWLGRRTTFYITMACYGIGAVGLFFSSTFALVLVFLAVLLAAAGGEMNMIMVAVHETMPTKHRSKVAMFGINFINLGGVIVALVDIFSRAYSPSVTFQRGMIVITLLFVLSLLLFVRTRTPESPRWLVRKGRTEQATSELLRFYGAEEIAARRAAIERAQARARAEARKAQAAVRRRRYPPLWLRLTAVIFVAFADTTGFGLLTYTLGPVHFPDKTAYIILATTLTGFASGILAFWADRFSRRWYLLLGYVGSLVFTLIAWITESTWAKYLALFYVLLVVLNVFVNLAYITEDTLKGEVWPTRYRARFTALCRFISIGGYIGTIYWTENFTTSQLIFFNVMVWVLGTVGALLWFYGGIETGQGTDIETVSNSEEQELLALPLPGAGAPASPGA